MTLPRGFAGVSGVTVRLMSDGAGVTPAARARNRSAAQGRSGRQVLLDNLGAGEPRDFVGMPRMRQSCASSGPRRVNQLRDHILGSHGGRRARMPARSAGLLMIEQRSKQTLVRAAR
jgi:hypothetical protein